MTKPWTKLNMCTEETRFISIMSVSHIRSFYVKANWWLRWKMGGQDVEHLSSLLEATLAALAATS